MKAKTPQEVGKSIESEFQLMLNTFSQKTPLSYERLYDTHSAGSYLPPMPSDFIVGYDSVTHFIELKSSAAFGSLSDGGALRKLVKDAQVAKMRMWVRSGCPGWFVFVSQETGTVEWWNGGKVIQVYLTPRGKLVEGIEHISASFPKTPSELVSILRMQHVIPK